jgi:hypothetical protein
MGKPISIQPTGSTRRCSNLILATAIYHKTIKQELSTAALGILLGRMFCSLKVSFKNRAKLEPANHGRRLLQSSSSQRPIRFLLDNVMAELEKSVASGA